TYLFIKYYYIYNKFIIFYCIFSKLRLINFGHISLYTEININDTIVNPINALNPYIQPNPNVKPATIAVIITGIIKDTITSTSLPRLTCNTSLHSIPSLDIII